MLRLFKLAWRDIWRNRRRSFLTMGAILFAVLLISVSFSAQFGTYDAMEQLMVRLSSSELQIQHRDFRGEQMLEHSMEEASLDVTALKAAHPWILSATRRLTGFGLASSDSGSTGVLLVGVEPDTEPAVSNMMQVQAGHRVLGRGDHGRALLGASLAKNLGLAVGDSVVILTQGYHNVMGAEIYAVQGLVRSGSPELDRALMITTLTAAQELFSMPGRFTALVLRTDAHRKAKAHAAALQASIQDPLHVAVPWQSLLPELDQWRRLDDASNYIFYMFLLLLIGFEIFNTTAMSMMERVREFGVMMAMGLKPHQISGLVAMELAMKTLIGIAAGLCVSVVLLMVLSQEPIALSQDMQEMYDDFGFVVDGFYFSSRPSIYVFPVVSVAVLAVVSMLFPVLKMRSFSPVKALRAV